MVHIPSALLITSAKALEVSPVFEETLIECYPQREALLQPSEQRRVLTLFLVYCYFIDQETVWSDYMVMLPSIDFFKEHHVLFQPTVLDGTSLSHAVRAKRSRLEQYHASLPSVGWLDQVTLEMILWADAVLWSRVVEIKPDRLAMIPFFDFANHSQQPNLRWELLASGDLVLVNTEAVEQGQELMLSYGAKPNQELLFIHGFCIPGNPVPSVLTLPWMPFFLNEDGMPKAQWLRHITPSTLKLNLPDPQKQGIERAGWDWTSVMIMYLAVLDPDEVDMVFTENGLDLQGQTITSLSDLEQVVCQFEYFPVIQLRAVVLLIQALEYLLAQPSNQDSNALSSQVVIYQTEEQQLIHQSMKSLNQLQHQLMTEPVVQAFLQTNAS
ncbi:hypothetical protein BD560DRAFT_333978 [Blakeslea trispora]|nr:hypothetical protein BD560DRAFT_333978 [Blakeslea trispora]